jgi:hypothetical protein
MKNAAAFQATYSDWRLIKGRKVVQVVFELPLEVANEAYSALGGMPNPAAETWFAIARLVQPAGKEVVGKTETTGAQHGQPASGDVPARAPRNKLAQLAGMLGKEPLFHRYVDHILTRTETNTDFAADYIRGYCGVESRSHLVADSDAGTLFLELYDDFKLWRDADAFVEAS